MSDTTEYVLARVFDLIEAEQLTEAQQLLKPLIESDRNNADVWWLYAHAVTDPETAQIALQNVLRIDKEYPEAQSLLRTLEATLPGGRPDSSHKEPFDLPNLPATLPDFPVTESEDDEDDEEGESRQRFLVPVVIMILILVIVVLLLQNPSGGGTSATPVADQLTNTPLPVQAVGGYEAIYQALSAFTLPDEAVSVETTSLGNTLIVTVCEADRRQARQTLPLILDALANQVESISGDIETVASMIQNCDTGEAWIAVGVPRQVAVDYAEGNLAIADFQAAWQPVE
jgi:hypothetical protein